jgi:Protein of unknown function (DUF2846)
MKIYLSGVFLVFSSFALSQTSPAQGAVAPGCGDMSVKFKVSNAHTTASPIALQPEKALVYFVQDDSHYLSHPHPTVRQGIDGNWVGATHSNSYYTLSVTPGEHHVCAIWQKKVNLFQGLKSSALHFTAEGGKVYFFRVENSWVNTQDVATLRLEPIDIDEGKLLIAKRQMTTSQPEN